MEELPKLSKKLINLRESKDWSKTLVANKLGLKNMQTYANWEYGKSEPSSEMIIRLAEIYGITTDKLLDKYNTASNIIPTSPTDFTEVPVVGTIKAGPNGLALENYQGVESVLKKDLGGGHDYFWLVVSGDSMIGDGIYDGDFALIKRTPEFNNGDICAIIVDGEEGTLKHVTKSKDSIVLTASNPVYQPRVFVGSQMNEILIAGRLVETKRKY
ncbi:XRE family transcriptional regulator [Lentilactobacillus senioris]|uniref:helix-turn-helix domain-containing protein n=1 Tax=Lentilactobacillus senioris TaxID=931534 RepID=UPI00227FD419|nr:XRE family transcriptional regulator [Lentilactobacillus senioris]MCY9806525.1 XRE family transcriptional regulator [Lentilactobacillus senioris]